MILMLRALAPLCCRDVEDYEWRPTFTGHMKMEPATRAEFDRNVQNRLYLAYAQRVAALDHPKRALRILYDNERTCAYQRAIKHAVTGATQPAIIAFQMRFLTRSAGKRVIVFEAGTGLLPVLSAAAGAASVVGAPPFEQQSTKHC